MFKYWKRFWFAKKICEKYNITLIMRYDTKEIAWFWHNNKIEISLFSENFYSSFLHELSHYFDFKDSKGYTSSSYNNRAVRGVTWKPLGYFGTSGIDNYNNLLYRESRANRYSIRLLKKLGMYEDKDLKWLTYCMTSYISNLPTEGKKNLQNKLTLADIDYRLNKYLTY
tara:strand:- start:804 stop:1310 length:507 start_codon:yes stop_codon:yes gene_type:complete